MARLNPGTRRASSRTETAVERNCEDGRSAMGFKYLCIYQGTSGLGKLGTGLTIPLSRSLSRSWRFDLLWASAAGDRVPLAPKPTAPKAIDHLRTRTSATSLTLLQAKAIQCTARTAAPAPEPVVQSPVLGQEADHDDRSLRGNPRQLMARASSTAGSQHIAGRSGTKRPLGRTVGRSCPAAPAGLASVLTLPSKATAVLIPPMRDTCDVLLLDRLPLGSDRRRYALQCGTNIYDSLFFSNVQKCDESSSTQVN